MVINDQQNTVRKFIFAGMLFVLYIGYVCSGTHGYKQTYMHTHVYIYIYIYIHIYIQTETHTTVHTR